MNVSARRAARAFPVGGVCALAILVALGLSASAQATSPGLNGRLACEGSRPIGAPTPPMGVNRTEVFTVNPDGSGETVLTHNDVRDGDPSFSPDGKTIAFESFRDGFSEAYTMAADGTGVTRLTSDGAPEDRGTSWSPDGRKIVFHSTRDGNFEIYTMNADGTDQRRITNNPAQDSLPAWSPDGSRIAFLSARDGDFELYTMNTDGTDQTRITNSPGEDSQPSWSPDGKQITFHSRRSGGIDIYRMNADGSNPTRLTFTPDDAEYFPVWSPDGTRIAYNGTDPITGDTDVYTINAVDGSDVTRVTTAPGFDGRCDWQSLPVPPSPTTPTPTPASGLLRDTVAPAATGVGVTNRVFAVSGDSTETNGVAARRRHKRGTTFRYTLTEKATVTIAIALRRSVRRRGKSCVAPTPRALRKAPTCVRVFPEGTLRRASHEGGNGVFFSGRIGSRALAPGAYQATLTAADSAGNLSRARTIFFTVVRR